MNSFRFIERGIDAEIARQTALLRAGDEVEQETLHFDPRTESITSLRSKEEAHDYRYFPEPDLVPVAIRAEMIDARRAALPELPAARAERYERELGLSADSARLLAFRAELGAYFEAALAATAPPTEPQPLANWVNELRRAHRTSRTRRSRRSRRLRWRALVGLVDDKKVTQDAAKQVLDRLVAEGGDPERDRRGRGPRRDRRRRRARRGRPARRSTPTPRSPSACAAAT